MRSRAERRSGRRRKRRSGKRRGQRYRSSTALSIHTCPPRAARPCLITCPHAHDGTTAQDNDPYAYELATEVYRQLCAASVPAVLLAGHVAPRSACDLNRAWCESSFHMALSHFLGRNPVALVDVHSFPEGSFDGATGPVLLTPRHAGEVPPRQAACEDALATFLAAAKMPGGANRIINEASQQGVASVLVEMPYRVDGDQFVSPDLPQLATGIVRAIKSMR